MQLYQFPVFIIIYVYIANGVAISDKLASYIVNVAYIYIIMYVL